LTQEELIEMLQQQIEELLEINAGLHRIIDSLNETVAESHQIIRSLNDTVAELNQRIKELTERLGMNSRNSSKPPSSNIFEKTSPKSLRGSSGKKTGGQLGHLGSHLDITAGSDEVIMHVPRACLGCPQHDDCVSRACVGETRKVADAVVTVKVTAHQSLVLDCPLYGISHKGEFPEDVKATVQYSENL